MVVTGTEQVGRTGVAPDWWTEEYSEDVTFANCGGLESLMPGDGKPDEGVFGDGSGQVWILKHLFCFVLWKLLQQFPQIAGLDLNPLEQ